MLRGLWLALAAAGALAPVSGAGVFNTGVFDGGVFDGGILATFDATVLILIATLWVWVISETAVRHNWLALIVLPAALFPGPACALPLWLYLRSAPVRQA